MAMDYKLYGATEDNKGTDVVTPGFIIPLIARHNANRESPQVYYEHPLISGTSVESSIAFGDLLVKVLKSRGL